MTTNENRTQAVRDALDTVNRTKAVTKRAIAIGRLIEELPTQDEVNAFTAELRRRAGVQDPALLPETTWKVRRSSDPHGSGKSYTTTVLVNTLDEAERVSISWPSVIFHWGVMVTFTWGGEAFVAHSADYAMTETYMSS